MSPRRVYLAGPEVFLPNSKALGAAKKALCEKHGFVGLYPLDNEVRSDGDGRRTARLIFAGNREMMDGADAIVANLSPFRGVSADPGTVFELGYMLGRGKRAAGYTLDPRPFFKRVEATFGPASFDGRRERWVDRDELAVENFGLSDNLMLEASLEQAGVPLVRGRSAEPGCLDDLAAFEECLVRLAGGSWC